MHGDLLIIVRSGQKWFQILSVKMWQEWFVAICSFWSKKLCFLWACVAAIGSHTRTKEGDIKETKTTHNSAAAGRLLAHCFSPLLLSFTCYFEQICPSENTGSCLLWCHSFCVGFNFPALWQLWLNVWGTNNWPNSFGRGRSKSGTPCPWAPTFSSLSSAFSNIICFSR